MTNVQIRLKPVNWVENQFTGFYMMGTLVCSSSEWGFKKPYKHTTWIPRWNDMETVISMSFQRGIHIVFVGLVWN